MDFKFPKNEPLFTYEEVELGILVALEKSELTKINQFRKNKGEKVPNTVSGYPFIHCDEQNSLKIDFEQKQEYLIDNLKKFN